ncbi:hypothetical protein HaLaN_22292 [Haematococcus lacustris]|uniref:Uncharacterized protein n=1 Tax=Haematococcus lacustris TaxID=44745 RepID=A0A699ZRC6_HAELA|nr:hypothetical protein HaLaN_22292 [Haematococcus lacustris]
MGAALAAGNAGGVRGSSQRGALVGRAAGTSGRAAGGDQVLACPKTDQLGGHSRQPASQLGQGNSSMAGVVDRGWLCPTCRCIFVVQGVTSAAQLVDAWCMCKTGWALT